jgi:hypothetical protein
VGGIEWGTVERSDGPLLADNTPDSEVLEVPELTEDTLNALEEVEAEASAPPNTDTPTQRGEPGSQVECEVCGTSVRVRRDGELSKHKCEPKAQRGNRFDHLPTRGGKAPRKARDFVIGVAAWCVEEGSAHVLARPFDADPSDVPSELPDAAEMLGPPLDLVWPSIPDSAQKFIETLADNSDLISCALMWGDWMRTLNRWTREQRAYQRQLTEQERQRGSTQFAATDGPGRVVPFTAT